MRERTFPVAVVITVSFKCIFLSDLEWVGDLEDLEHSQHTIARYIRSLVNHDEELLDAAIRLS